MPGSQCSMLTRWSSAHPVTRWASALLQQQQPNFISFLSLRKWLCITVQLLGRILSQQTNILHMGVMQTETSSHLVPLSQYSRQTADHKHDNAVYYRIFGLQPEHCIPEPHLACDVKCSTALQAETELGPPCS